jgi:GntR family transcriptional regulator/MocR family aminotransferase
VRPGDAVMLENPGYVGARSLFTALGAKQIPIPVDVDGADSTAVARAIDQHPKLLHLTPSHQYPTGATLSAARRMEILELAGEHGFMIVEDDYDSEYRYEGRPVRALAGIDGADAVIYVGSFSKVMYPSLRVGYVVAPEWLIEAMVGLRWHIDFMPPMLESAALAQFIEEGHFERHLRRMRTLYAEKRRAFTAILAAELPGALPNPLPPGGMKIMLHVPAHLTRQEAFDRALKVGVRVYDTTVCYFEPEKAPKMLTIGFTALPIEKVKDAAYRLAKAWG